MTISNEITPRTINTAVELDALPDDSLVLASGKTLNGEFTNCWIRPVPTSISGSTERRVWEALVYFDAGYQNMTAAESINYPATVLYEPGSTKPRVQWDSDSILSILADAGVAKEDQFDALVAVQKLAPIFVPLEVG